MVFWMPQQQGQQLVQQKAPSPYLRICSWVLSLNRMLAVMYVYIIYISVQCSTPNSNLGVGRHVYMYTKHWNIAISNGCENGWWRFRRLLCLLDFLFEERLKLFPVCFFIHLRILELSVFLNKHVNDVRE